MDPEIKKKRKLKRLSKDDIEMMNNPEAWDDNIMTTTVWETVNSNDIQAFKELLYENPELAHVRSKDGRGPLWWAHEYGRGNFVKLLKKLGVSDQLKDVKGLTPLDISRLAKEDGL